MRQIIQTLYTATVLKRPIVVCALLACILCFFAVYTKDFKLNASADALLLNDDPDLILFREVAARYTTKDFLIVTFTPYEDLFSVNSLEQIKNLRDQLRKLPTAESVISLVDVPLVLQVEGSISDLVDNVRTLESDGIDLTKARQELLNSPIYKELIISEDGTTTAIQINLKDQPDLRALQKQRALLLLKKQNHQLTATETTTLDQVLYNYANKKNEINQINHDTILSIRALLKQYRDYGDLHLGGVTMIADDMIRFIKNDLIVFGIGVLLFLIGILTFIFRKPRWVILPLASCLYASLLMLGLLGLVAWDVTVISSNFISLMLIITISMNIHLIMRYRQLSNAYPKYTQQQLVLAATSKMVWPCFYTALTTIMAFSSLVVSGIKPVIDFGWMMTIGLTITFLVSFILLPTLLVLLPKTIEKFEADDNALFTTTLAHLTERHGNKMILLTLLLTAISVVGITRLEVENSFINYFSEETEIYQGLRLIDDKLGGTTPLDIMLNLDEQETTNVTAETDELDSLFEDIEPQDNHWFTLERLELIKSVHDYLDTLPAIGKVSSVASIIRVGEQINKAPFDAFELAVISKQMPAEFRQSTIDPYLSEQHNQARINIRIRDSMKDLRRQELLETIKHDLKEQYGLGADKVQITGILVLYNNMLQSLFRSQILTLGTVMAGIALMLIILFRSFSLAMIGIIPNILAGTFILGLMGLLQIPLDMMTITIAAITVGIAVDNSIHYIYRFREEFPKHQDYIKTMHYCHAHIGRAVFYTATTIIIGFSILVLSNFVPTIYFGLLTALAMTIALFAALTLLPKLILMFKPFS